MPVEALLLRRLEGFQGREGRQGLLNEALSFTVKTFVVYTALTGQQCPLGSVVEHSLHTRGVRSSNLLAGTIFSTSYGRPF